MELNQSSRPVSERSPSPVNSDHTMITIDNEVEVQAHCDGTAFLQLNPMNRTQGLAQSPLLREPSPAVNGSSCKDQMEIRAEKGRYGSRTGDNYGALYPGACRSRLESPRRL